MGQLVKLKGPGWHGSPSSLLPYRFRLSWSCECQRSTSKLCHIPAHALPWAVFSSPPSHGAPMSCWWAQIRPAQWLPACDLRQTPDSKKRQNGSCCNWRGKTLMAGLVSLPDHLLLLWPKAFCGLTLRSVVCTLLEKHYTSYKGVLINTRR